MTHNYVGGTGSGYGNEHCRGVGSGYCDIDSDGAGFCPGEGDGNGDGFGFGLGDGDIWSNTYEEDVCELPDEITMCAAFGDVVFTAVSAVLEEPFTCQMEYYFTREEAEFGLAMRLISGEDYEKNTF